MLSGMQLVYVAVVSLLINSGQSWYNPPKSFLSSFSQNTAFRRLSYFQIASSDLDDEEKAPPPKTSSRPPIMPFDFARDDIPLPKVSQPKVTKKDDSEDNSKSVVSSRSASNRWIEDEEKTVINTPRKKWVEDPSRPTGYINQDEDDDDWVPSQDSEGVQKFLKDYFFDQEFDSMKRKDAKSVIRNVTLISGILGTIYTILCISW
jgi:hypothetical protein